MAGTSGHHPFGWARLRRVPICLLFDCLVSCGAGKLERQLDAELAPLAKWGIEAECGVLEVGDYPFHIRLFGRRPLYWNSGSGMEVFDGAFLFAASSQTPPHRRRAQ
jgi:hypothetical protein